MHLAHLQFYGYGTEGKRKFSSAAARLAELVNGSPEMTIDVGQVMFGQTVTISLDVMRQFMAKGSAHPKKSVIHDGDGNGAGIVPYRYRKDFYGTLQWAIGLELFLLIEDPWRVFLTTDHPNGAPFTAYPHLIRLLMDRSFRESVLATIHRGAAEMSALPGLAREYSLREIAIVTRAGPARSLGLEDRGHLGVGAVADVTVYREQADRQAMFERAEYVFKDGRLVVKDGEVVEVVDGATHVARAPYDAGIEKPLRRHFEDYRTMRLENFVVADDEITGAGGRLIEHASERAGA